METFQSEMALCSTNLINNAANSTISIISLIILSNINVPNKEQTKVIPTKEQVQSTAIPTYISIKPVALHRFYCGQNHFYTTDIQEGIKARCIYENIIGYVYYSQIPGTEPFYRFFNGQDHFYTLNKNEGIKAGYIFERIEGYIYSYQVSNTKPFYRFFNGQDHFYTLNENEGTKAGYAYEFIAGYISPPQN